MSKRNGRTVCNIRKNMLPIAKKRNSGGYPTVPERSLQERKKRLESLNLVSFSHRGRDGKLDLEGVGRTLDLSEGGILLEIVSSVPELSEVLEITIGVRKDIIKVHGRIVHQRQLENGHFALGISFTDLSPTGRTVITRFLEQEEG